MNSSSEGSCWRKADGVQVSEGSSPSAHLRANTRTPPGSESGACAHRGSSNLGEPVVSLPSIAGSGGGAGWVTTGSTRTPSHILAMDLYSDRQYFKENFLEIFTQIP